MAGEPFGCAESVGEQVDSGRAWLRGEVTVDAHHDQVRAGDIAEGFERDRKSGDGGLPPVGAQIVAKPAHEPGVIDLAGRFVIGLFGFLLFFVGHRLGGMRLPSPL